MSEQLTWDEAVAALTGAGGRFALVDAEVRGARTRVFANAPPSLRALFALARERAEQEFLVYEEERWTFGDLMQRVDEIADALVERYGVAPGDRVAIAMRNFPEWIAAFAAVTSVGAIAVCLNAWWTSDELTYGLEDSGTRVLIADLERIERARPGLAAGRLRALVVRSGDAALPEHAERVENVISPGAGLPDVQIDPDDDATILYTSGTTGHPKGAVSTHRAILNALFAFGCRAAVNQAMRPPTEPHPWPPSFILIVPLFHVTGLVPVLLSCVLGGFKLVMMYRWNPERALELIERERVTNFVGVPTMSWDLLESPDFARRDTSSLTNVGGGGAPAPPELVARIDRSFRRGTPGMGYGMTETNAYGPQNSGAALLARPRSAGRPVPILAVKVIDERGAELPRGEIGEICFRGATLIRGYWGKPEATAEAIVDGWLRSGDLGRMDEEGFVYVEDRLKDMVLRAGENVYSAEVEAAIYEHPSVHEAAVFGLPHQRLGEEVAAVVMTRRDATLSAQALDAYLRERLAAFKVPTVIEFTSTQLPRNASGKILKRALRDEIAARLGRD